MKRRWPWRSDRGRQVVSQTAVQGHIFQIRADGDVSIDVADTEPLDDPGTSSISPPADYIGRPIRGRDQLVSDVLRNAARQQGEIQVLCGMGGSGKSTLAMLVANAAQDQQVDSWWIDATDKGTLYAGMRQLSLKIGAPPERVTRAWSGKESAIDLLWEFLEVYPRKWLIVLDGADDNTILCAVGSRLRDGNGWLRPPRTHSGSIVVTSRDSNPDDWATWCSFCTIDRLSDTAGAAVLLDYAGTRAGSPADAEDLSRRLGGLPLALRLAGTYLKESWRFSWPGAIKSFGEYNRTLEAARLAELFPELDDAAEVGVDRDARELVGKTWELTLQLLSRRGIQAAHPILQQLSHLSNNPIPVSILRSGVLNGYGITKDLSRSGMRKAVEALANFGLIDIRPSIGDATRTATLVLHPVVRDVSRYGNRLLRSRTAYHSAAAVMTAETLCEMGKPTPRSWPLWELFLRHSSYLLHEFKKDRAATATAISAAAYCGHRAAQFLMHRAEYDEAIALQRSSLEFYEALFGPDDPSILPLRHDIAVALGRTGRLREAEVELKDIHRRRAALHGSEGTQTLATLHAYADILWQSGALPAAQTAYEFILDAFSKKGGYSENVLGTENNLVQVLIEQGKYAEAASRVDLMLESARAHEFDETILLQARFTRARIRIAQAQYPEAIAELESIYDGQRRMLGESHPITLASRHELGVALQEGGQPEEACAVLRPTFELRRKRSGDNHFETLNTRHQLAVALHESGRREEAKDHYTATLERRQGVHGPDNHLTLATRHQLAVLLLESGDLSESEREFRAVLAGERKALGYDHPSVLMTRSRLVLFDVIRGNICVALAEVKEISEKAAALPPGHPAVRQIGELIAALRAVGVYGRA